MKIELHCSVCGGNRFNYPLVLTDDELIFCADCNHVIGTVADLQKKVIEQLAKQSGD